MSEIAYSIGANSVTVFDGGEVHMIDSTDGRFGKIKAALAENPPNTAEALRLMDIKAVIKQSSAGRVGISEDGVTFEGSPISGYMAERLVAMASSGMDVKPWMMFMDNLMENPLEETRVDLFKWMEHGKMPITEDGCIVGFKKVNANYTDVHTGKFDNSVGSFLEMPREQCDTSRHNTCSTGFHFCSADYLSNFGGKKVMVVKIDPRDVTAIPSDYNNSKARCCKYLVTGELSSASAARHNVFSDPVMPEDPREIPGLMMEGSEIANTPKVKPKTKGPKSTVKTGGVKVAANVAAATKKAADKIGKAAKPKEEAVATTTKKKATAKPAARKTPAKKTTSTTAKVVKAVKKAATKTAKVVVEAVTPTPAPKKKAAAKPKATTAKKPAESKAPARKAPAKPAAKKTSSGRIASKAPAKSNAPKTSKAVAAPKPKSTGRKTPVSLVEAAKIAKPAAKKTAAKKTTTSSKRKK